MNVAIRAHVSWIWGFVARLLSLVQIYFIQNFLDIFFQDIICTLCARLKIELEHLLLCSSLKITTVLQL